MPTQSLSSLTRTKIICTLTPARTNEAALLRLIDQGMDVIRLNFSHMNPADAVSFLELVHRVRREQGIPLPLLLDTKGPEVRLYGYAQPVPLQKGDEIVIRSYAGPDLFSAVSPEPMTFYTNLEQVGRLVSPGARVLLMDGYIEGRVTDCEDTAVRVQVLNAAALRPRAHFSLPGVDYPLPFLAPKDVEDIRYAVQAGFEYIALSFVRSAEDIFEVRRLIRHTNEASPIKLIAKIESKRAIDNLDEIIHFSDGVMVARGDLGVELDLEDVPVMQKRIIERCYLSGKPVITATQMLETMIHSRVPTRAEVSDVANACYDLTSAVMLSGETAVGDDPALVVNTMDRIIRRVESSFDYESTLVRLRTRGHTRDLTTVIGYNAVNAAYQCQAAAMVVFTKSGYSARMVSKLRPHLPILAFTPDETVFHQLALNWGVFPRLVPHMDTFEQMLAHALQACLDEELVMRGDLVVIVAGLPIGNKGATNMIRVETVGRSRLPGRLLSGGDVTAPLAHITCAADLDSKDITGKVVVLHLFEKEFAPRLRNAAGIIALDDDDAGELEALGTAYSIPVLVEVRDADTMLEEGATVFIDAEKQLAVEL